MSCRNNGILLDVVKIVLGSILYALSVVLFIDPVSIIPGSVTGIAVVVKALCDVPIGLFSIIINVPLVIWGTIKLGKKLLVYTGLTILFNSLLIDALAYMTPFTNNVMLASIFGGILMGIGLGLILDSGGTTGGTTVIGRLVTQKNPAIKIGNILLIGDFIIIMVGSLLLQNWDLLLYSLINLYICVVAINLVIYGPKTKQAALVFSQYPPLKAALNAQFPCTIKEFPQRTEFICICKKADFSRIQLFVQQADPDASCVSMDIDSEFGILLQKEVTS